VRCFSFTVTVPCAFRHRIPTQCDRIGRCRSHGPVLRIFAEAGHGQFASNLRGIRLSVTVAVPVLVPPSATSRIFALEGCSDGSFDHERVAVGEPRLEFDPRAHGSSRADTCGSGGWVSVLRCCAGAIGCRRCLVKACVAGEAVFWSHVISCLVFPKCGSDGQGLFADSACLLRVSRTLYLNFLLERYA